MRRTRRARGGGPFSELGTVTVRLPYPQHRASCCEGLFPDEVTNALEPRREAAPLPVPALSNYAQFALAAENKEMSTTIERQLQDAELVVAATDYVRAYPQLIAPYLASRFVSLGADGFGRSDTRLRLRR